MKKSFLTVCCIFIIFVLLMTADLSSAQNHIKSVSKQGYVGFILNTDKTYKNGGSDEDFTQTLLELPGLGKCLLSRSYTYVVLSFEWEKEQTHQGYYLTLSELPGPQKYFLQFTWDAEKGLSDGYINGNLFRKENPKYYSPWEINGLSESFEIHEGPNKVSDVEVIAKYLPQNEIKKKVPEELFGKMAHLIEQKDLPASLDTNNRKGRLLYSSKMDDKSALKNWVLEGPAEINFENNSMIMRSKIPNPPDLSTGHFNYWCPVEFPENFILEWEYKPLGERGVCHLFFAAKGKNGEDLFDSTLPERDGHYPQYHSGAINNYYVIYFSNMLYFRTSNMATSWLIKSNKLASLVHGKIAVVPGEKRYHKMCLIKEGGHIQLLTDGRVCLNFTDPGGERWGQVYGDGKIGFRQMARVVAAYRNFSVWELR